MNGQPLPNRRNSNQTAQVLSGDIHVNDVLFGRGINLAGLAGNERLRALAKARRDKDYCEKFSSSEKRALAVEIVQHIHSLDPPGRFLKRPQGFETTRNYQGHWEVLSEKDAIKKATQTLRDCNRSDRKGYANEVEAPDDVIEFANRLTNSGLSLRKYAEALVAQSGRSSSPYVLDGQTFANPPPVHHSPVFARGGSPSGAAHPMEDQPPVHHWQEPPPPMVHTAPAAHAAPSPSAFPGQETPAPYKAPVPVSTTPPSPNHNHANPDLASEYNQHDHFADDATSPILQSPSNFVNETDNDHGHSYSPSALDFGDSHRSLETDPQLDAYTSQHHPHTNEIEDHTPRPFSLTDEDELDGPQPQDVLQNAAAAFSDHRVDHRRTNSLTLMAGDDAFFNH